MVLSLIFDKTVFHLGEKHIVNVHGFGVGDFLLSIWEIRKETLYGIGSVLEVYLIDHMHY